jgi:NTE family protein
MATPRVGLVLGAGGVAGHAFHAGVLAALADTTGWDPRSAEIVLGTSAGSMVGSSLRAGLSAPDLFARVTDRSLSPEGREILAGEPQSSGTWQRVARSGLPLPASPAMLAHLLRRPWRARPGLVTAALLPHGRFDPATIREGVDRLLAPRIEDPLWVAAVRLRDGRRIVFGRPGEPVSEGWSWGQAVAASCAIPGFFAPVLHDGERYVDGGAHSPTNADLLADRGLDTVVVLSPMSATRSAGIRGIDAPVRGMYRLRLAAEVARLRRTGVSVFVFQPTREVLAAAGINAMDPARRVPVARAAHAAASRRLDEGTGDALTAALAA